MTISQAISAYIPYLRRFSRALTGTQAGGDAYVLATLEAIVADPAEFSKCAEPKTALYRLFLKVWGSVPINDHVDPASFTSDEAGAQRHLEAITLRPRIAFLLSSLEGFDTTEVAGALDCTEDEAAGLIDAAGKEIANQIRTDVLIIEDEPFIALDLQNLVEEQGTASPMSRGLIARRSTPSGANRQASSSRIFSLPTEARVSTRSIRFLNRFSYR